jgi:hypothetical protein
VAPHRWLALALLGGLVAEVGFESGLRLNFKFLIDEAILQELTISTWLYQMSHLDQSNRDSVTTTELSKNFT